MLERDFAQSAFYKDHPPPWVKKPEHSQRIVPLDFLRENPTATWQDGLSYVLKHYPTEGWRLEGGAAVHLINPRRREPHDLDILFADYGMFSEFARARIATGLELFHPRLLQEWLKERSLPYTQRNIDIVMQTRTSANFQGKDVPLLDKENLILSKGVLYGKKEPRKTDIEDLVHLGATAKDIRRAAHRLGGVPRASLPTVLFALK